MQKATLTSAAMATEKFSFGMCNCMVDSDFGMDYFSPGKGNLQMCLHEHVQLHLSPGMDKNTKMIDRGSFHVKSPRP